MRARPWALPLVIAAAAGCGAGGDGACTPGDTVSCYDGPPGTAGVGACLRGHSACLADGSGYGPCEGEVLPSVERCDTLFNESCDGLKTCSGLVRWAEAFGDVQAQSIGVAAALGADGVIVAGQVEGTLGLGHHVALDASPGQAAFLAAFDGEGRPVWARLLGVPEGATTVSSVSAGADGGVLAAGWFTGATDLGRSRVEGASDGSADAFLLALDRRGDVRWQKVLGGPGDQRAWISPPDAAGRRVLTAIYTGTLDLGTAVLHSAFADPTTPDLAVVRLDAAADVIWANSATGGFQPLLTEGYVTPAPAVAALDGTVFVAAGVAGPFEIGGSSAQLASTQGATLAAAFDPHGQFLWSQVFSSAADGGIHVPGSVAAGPDGNLWLMTGLTRPNVWPLPTPGLVDGVTATELTTGGVELWHTLQMSGTGGDAVLDGAGNLVFATTDLSNLPVPMGLTVRKMLPSSGAVLWSYDLGAGADTRLAVDATGGVRMAGTFTGTVTVGATSLTSTVAVPGSMDPDILLAATSP
jgi:hypothetical protein